MLSGAGVRIAAMTPSRGRPDTAVHKPSPHFRARRRVPRPGLAGVNGSSRGTVSAPAVCVAGVVAGSPAPFAKRQDTPEALHRQATRPAAPGLAAGRCTARSGPGRGAGPLPRSAPLSLGVRHTALSPGRNYPTRQTLSVAALPDQPVAHPISAQLAPHIDHEGSAARPGPH